MNQTEKLYPLTSSQQMILLSLTQSIKKAISNLNILIHFDCEIDKKLIIQAATLAIMRNEPACVRMRQVTEKKNKFIRQYFFDAIPDAIESYSFDNQEEFEETINEWNCTPNNEMDAKLYRIVFIIKPNGKYAFYFCMNRIAFDEYALMLLIQDLISIYQAMCDNTAIPEKKPFSISVYEEEWKYSGSHRYKEDIHFWQKVFEQEPCFSDIHGPESQNLIRKKNYGTVLKSKNTSASQISFSLSGDLIRKTISFAQKQQIDCRVVYLLAIREYLTKENNSLEDIMILDSVERRNSSARQSAGGTFIHEIPFRMNFSNTITFAEACNTMELLRKSYYSHADLAPSEISQMVREKFNVPRFKGYSTVAFSYHPHLSALENRIPLHFTYCSNGASVIPLKITIAASHTNGDFICNYDYLLNAITAEKIKSFHHYLTTFLDRAIESPEKSLADLM